MHEDALSLSLSLPRQRSLALSLVLGAFALGSWSARIYMHWLGRLAVCLGA